MWGRLQQPGCYSCERRNFLSGGQDDGTCNVVAHLSLVRRRLASTGLMPCSPRRLMPWSTFGSFVTHFGVRYADRPPDREHRFGHEKGEAVAEVGPASVLEIVEGGDEAVERTKAAVKRAPGSAVVGRADICVRAPIQPPPQMRDCLCCEPYLKQAFAS